MNEHVAFVIRTVRKVTGFTQAQLAEELEITPGHVASLEQGKANPSYGVMDRIISKYHIDANLFFGRPQKDAASIDVKEIETMQDLLSKVSEKLEAYGQFVRKPEEDED